MPWKRLLFVAAIGLSAGWALPSAHAGGLRIPLPRHGMLTPVQRLNREGVEAIRKNEVDKAKALFYQAYLYDPDDPFTLNNLGYIAELEGQVERAQRFYALAAQHPTEAVIDRASSQRVEGKPLREAVSVQGAPLQVNRANVEAIRLLSQGRAIEAENLLQRTLTTDPRNAFTLNNMGVAKEMQGDFDAALKYYTAAADLRSAEPVIVTLSGTWRGKPVSEMAADSAKKIRDRMQSQENVQARIARLNLQGVSAINSNNWQDARQYFHQAYNLDPTNAFSLNNLGYLAEMDGDPETAQFYYEKARAGERANVRVGFATRHLAEGMKLFEVAEDNDSQVEARIDAAREARRRQSGPIELKHRNNQPVVQPPSQTPPQAPQTPEGLGPPQPPIPQLTPAPQPPAPQPPEPNQLFR